MRRQLIIGAMCVPVASCSAERNPSPSTNPVASSPTAATTLRACASLVGGPFAAASSGQTITCSVAGDGTNPATVELATYRCPSGGPWYKIGVVHDGAFVPPVYLGSQSGVLHRSDGTVTEADEQQAACSTAESR